MILVESAGRDAVTVRVPAKINVTLAVLGRRPDGYHDIDTVMLPLTIQDRLTARRERGGGLVLVAPGTRGLPLGRDNTVLRAARALRARARASCGVRFELEKRIPVGAGLGGGSADAAAALVTLDRLWERRSGPRALRAFAAAIGSDVPFFLGRGAARARGRGERLTPVACRGPFHVVLVYPRFAASTADVYRNLKFPLTVRRPHANIARVLKSLRDGDAAALGAHLWNDLEASALSLFPRLRALRRALNRFPFLGVGMSGSGSAFFGVCRNRHEALRLASRVRRARLGRVWAVEAGPRVKS